MIVTIGTTTNDKRDLNKLFSGVDVTVQPKQPCDILNPVFVLDYNSEFVSANYVYCPDFGRYYFIVKPPTLLQGHRMELSCSVDVLMSFNANIKNVSALVVRQEHAGLSLQSDPSVMIKNYAIIDSYPFPSRFDTAFGSYVMQVIGGD